jgi:hypothetical protein
MFALHTQCISLWRGVQRGASLRWTGTYRNGTFSVMGGVQHSEPVKRVPDPLPAPLCRALPRAHSVSAFLAGGRWVGGPNPACGYLAVRGRLRHGRRTQTESCLKTTRPSAAAACISRISFRASNAGIILFGINRTSTTSVSSGQSNS